MNPPSHRPGYYPAPYNPGAPKVEIIKDATTGKYTFKVHLPPDEVEIYKKSQVYRNWEMMKLSDLEGQDLAMAARRKAKMELIERRRKEKMMEEELKREHEEWKARKVAEKNADPGEGTSKDPPQTPRFSIMDSYKPDTGYAAYLDQIMCPSISATLEAKNSGASKTFHSPYTSIAREMEQDKLQRQIFPKPKTPRTPKKVPKKRGRKPKETVIEDFDHDQPSTSTAFNYREKFDSEETKKKDSKDEDFIPSASAARINQKSNYSLRTRGTRTAIEQDDEGEERPTLDPRHKSPTKTVKWEWTSSRVDSEKFQATIPDVTFQSDREDRDELIYVEPNVPLNHEVFRNIFYRAIWRQFKGLIKMEDALKHWRQKDFSFLKALETIDDVLREKCSEFEPSEMTEVKRHYYQPMILDHQRAGKARSCGYKFPGGFDAEYRREFFFFYRDQHLTSYQPPENTIHKRYCHCDDSFTKDIDFEPRWGCSNCTKKNRGSNRLCLICKTYKELSNGATFPAKKVHFLKHDKRQMKEWKDMEILENRKMEREEFEERQKDNKEAHLLEISESETPLKELHPEELKSVQEYYNLMRKRKNKGPRSIKYLGGAKMAKFLTPLEQNLIRKCDCDGRMERPVKLDMIEADTAFFIGNILKKAVWDGVVVEKKTVAVEKTEKVEDVEKEDAVVQVRKRGRPRKDGGK